MSWKKTLNKLLTFILNQNATRLRFHIANTPVESCGRCEFIYARTTDLNLLPATSSPPTDRRSYKIYMNYEIVSLISDTHLDGIEYVSSLLDCAFSFLWRLACDTCAGAVKIINRIITVFPFLKDQLCSN